MQRLRGDKEQKEEKKKNRISKTSHVSKYKQFLPQELYHTLSNKIYQTCNGTKEATGQKNSGVVRGKTSLMNYSDLSCCYSVHIPPRQYHVVDK
jgi:hypothetical protein